MNKIENLLKNKITEAVFSTFNIELEDDFVIIEIPKDSNNGDYSTNIAMKLTKSVKQKPSITANMLVEKLNETCEIAEKIEVAGVGFINFFIKSEVLAEIINTVIEAKDDYGKNNSGNNLKIRLNMSLPILLVLYIVDMPEERRGCDLSSVKIRL